MMAATTEDFMAFEEGKIYSNDSVFADMNKIIPYTAKFNFENFKITGNNNFGHLSYTEHAEFIVRDTLKLNLNFVGSAALRNENGVWKMYFMQATKKYVRKTK